ncbi:MAG: hypothetical protein AAF431_12765 [Pseudomonadota bacterium]
MKNALRNLTLLLVSIPLCIVLAEVLTQTVVSKILLKGRLFESDAVVGWKVLPNLNLQRRNADGNPWVVRTDQLGQRIMADPKPSTHRLLILGDSFAFGQGVDVEQRFDARLSGMSYDIINSGVMGYGTDQQFLAAEPYLNELQNGDLILLLTYFNDFYDLSVTDQSGRAKPRYTIVNGGLVMHPPRTGFHNWLSDQSYLYATLSSRIAKQQTTTEEDLLQAAKVYNLLIAEHFARLESRGVQLVVAHHGVSGMPASTPKDIILSAINLVCASGYCINLDKHIDVTKNKELYLKDGHWNAEGHRLVGIVIAEKLNRMKQTRSDPQ